MTSKSAATIPVWVVLVVILLVPGCDIRDEAPSPFRPRPLLGEGAAATGGKGERAIEYVGGFEAARQRARAEERPVFVVCSAGWCRFSAEMTQRTLCDPRLVAVSRRAVCVLLDADRDAESCRALDVTAFPTLLVIDEDGERLRITGRSPPDGLVTALDKAFQPRRVASTVETPAAR